MSDFFGFLVSMLPLAVTMLVAGGLGGLAAFLTSAKPAAVTVRFGAWGFCLVGMIAALTVPLFLSLLQSKVLDDVETGENPETYLIFASFCILAGFSAKGFLTSLSDRVINELTNKMADTQQKAEAQIQELKANIALAQGKADTSSTSSQDALPPKLGQIGRSLTPFEKDVLKAAGSLAVRTVEGIAMDCGLPRETVETAIGTLVDRNLADRVSPPGIGGRLIRLTEDGAELAARLSLGALL